MSQSDGTEESRSQSPVVAPKDTSQDAPTVEPTAGAAAPDETANDSSQDEPEAPIDEKKEKKVEQDAPPLPEEMGEAAPPPLPEEPVPEPQDDGWDCQWDANTQAWFFYNRFTGKTQWDNPRVSTTAAAAAAPAPAPTAAHDTPPPPVNEKPVAGGYNPAIHGDYDPNAWYAKGTEEKEVSETAMAAQTLDPYGATATFNRFTGQFQAADLGPGRHSDEAKAKRQMNAFFDVDAAANAHDGRSLKAERSSKKPSKAELKAFKEKRKARKEEKRRAWLRD
ncbi:hypothetical protein B0I35DRAFT_420004 [Stachybotrys elegans]|uniref:WW domain-containing protein n=1 Tax=Stachybotrys elegans TaxID=80388 RepID=A0A8K0T8W7_9HYPO|nr:hypothetical protein B0I35DRAFT_420004 [Stachybotrys elegans]